MAIALSIFVIISSAELGKVYIIKSLLYPIFIFQVIILWCTTGQAIVDEVS